MTSACWAILAFAAAPQDDGEIERRIGELSDDDPAVRDEAERRLLGIGRAALAALQRAARMFRDPEGRDRAARLLMHPVFLSIRPDLAEPLMRLGSERDVDWIAAVQELLAAGRDVARGVLALWVRHGEETARFRAEQLLAILGSRPVNGLMYGIVVSRRASSAAPSGIEIWINVSAAEVCLEDNMGAHSVEILEVQSASFRVGGGAACGGRSAPVPTFRLSPGQARVRGRDSFFATTIAGPRGVSSRSVHYGPGLFEVWTEYSSAAGRDDFGWGGRIQSNRVRVAIE